jgi:hypothetical protein
MRSTCRFLSAQKLTAGILFGIALFYDFEVQKMTREACYVCIPYPAVVAIFCCSLFLILFTIFYLLNRSGNSFYFDAQDFSHYESDSGDPLRVQSRVLPVSAKQGTFEPFLDKYIGVTKLLITVAAASIAFGSSQGSTNRIFIAKIILAFAILYGVAFSALLVFFYEQYAQNVHSYRPILYSLIQALGFSCLICFISGYFAWALELG